MAGTNVNRGTTKDAVNLGSVGSANSGIIFEVDNFEPTPVDLVEEGKTELRFDVPVTRATVDESLNLLWQRGDRITVTAYDGANQIFAKQATFWAKLTDNSAAGSQSYFKVKFDSASEANELAQLESMADGIWLVFRNLA